MVVEPAASAVKVLCLEVTIGVSFSNVMARKEHCAPECHYVFWVIATPCLVLPLHLRVLVTMVPLAHDDTSPQGYTDSYQLIPIKRSGMNRLDGRFPACHLR